MIPRLIQIRFNDGEVRVVGLWDFSRTFLWPALCRLTLHGSVKLGESANRRFQFNKRSQQFIRVHDETLSVVAIRDLQSRSFRREI